MHLYAARLSPAAQAAGDRALAVARLPEGAEVSDLAVAHASLAWHGGHSYGPWPTEGYWLYAILWDGSVFSYHALIEVVGEDGTWYLPEE